MSEYGRRFPTDAAVGFGVGVALSAAYVWFSRRQENSRNTRIPVELLRTAYSKELKVAVECALLAGAAMKDAINADKTIQGKPTSAVDFVTDVDVLNEKIIFDTLRRNFDHKFIGEESSAAGQLQPVQDGPTWIVDPIDGTTNFMHENPNVCVSIGLSVARQSVLGVVYAPCFDELYLCIKGHGSFLNGRRLFVSPAKSLQEALIETNIGYVRSEDGVRRISECMRTMLLARCHGFREMGSSVLSLCYLAAGRLDAVYGGCAGDGGYPWDYCASTLMVTEAGGQIRQIDGTEYNIDARSVLAASTHELCEELCGAVKSKA